MSQHRFPALKSIAWIIRILGWIVALMAVVSFFLIMFTDYMQFQVAGLPNWAMGVIALLAGAFYLLILLACAEGIMVLLAIEENTRKAVEK